MLALERRTSLTPCPQMDGSNWFCLGPSGSDDPVLRDGLFQLITAENLEVQYYLVFSFFFISKIKTSKSFFASYTFVVAYR